MGHKKLFGFSRKNKEKEEREQTAQNIGLASGMSDISKKHAQQAAERFAKPDRFDRKLLRKSGEDAKDRAFGNNALIKDPYSGKDIFRRKADAMLQYGKKNMSDHSAETDHIKPLNKVYDETKNNPWLSNGNIADTANSDDNLRVTNRTINNAKRDRTNEQFVNDTDYLEKKGIELSEDGKQRMLDDGARADRSIKKGLAKKSVKNFMLTGHRAGIEGAKYGAAIGGGMSMIKNSVAAIKGEKCAGEAVADTVKDTAGSAATGYFSSFFGTNLTHIMASSGNTVMKVLSKSNLPSTIVACAIETVKTTKKFLCGEIDGTEYLTELGEKGTGTLSSTIGATVGQFAIPIPVVGGLVGGLVGYAFSSSYYKELVTVMKNRKLAHQELEAVKKECDAAMAQMKQYRRELEELSEKYFADMKETFTSAFAEIESGIISGSADKVISGSNAITAKLGGEVQYNSMKEFDTFMNDTDSDFVL